MIFDLEHLKKQIDDEERYTDIDGIPMKSVFIGTVFALLPSGKYYTPYANSNVSEEEAEKDKEWWQEADDELDKIDAFITPGEGDPCDLFVTRLVTLEDLMKEAKEACDWRGHKMMDWKVEESEAFALCARCGASVHVTTNPPPNGIDISGSAVAGGCADAKTS